MARSERDGTPEGRLGRPKTALLLLEIAEHDISTGSLGREADGFLAGIQRFMGQAHRVQDQAEIEQRLVVAGLRRDRSANELDGLSVVTALVSDKAQMMQARGMIRMQLQHALVSGLGLDPLSSFEVLHGNGKLVCRGPGTRWMPILQRGRAVLMLPSHGRPIRGAGGRSVDPQACVGLM